MLYAIFWHQALVVSKTVEFDTVSEYGCWYDLISGHSLIDNEGVGGFDRSDKMKLYSITYFTTLHSKYRMFPWQGNRVKVVRT